LNPENHAMNFMPPPLHCLSLIGLSLVLAACDTPPTVVDQHFGLAVQRAQAQQSLLTPDAEQPVLWRCPPEQLAPNCPRQSLLPRQGMGPKMGLGASRIPTGHNRLRTDPDSDGAAALAAVTRYQQSFQTPPAPTPIFNIGLGASSAP
jgi:hypothetical protein